MYNVFKLDNATVAIAQEVTASINNELGGYVIMGSAGADDTVVTNFADGLAAGDGDDIIRLQTMGFSSIDGGRGYDQIYFELKEATTANKVVENGQTVINTALFSASALTNIEEINLGQDSTTATDNQENNLLILTPQKVLEMTDDDNLLVVSGTNRDSINLYGNWSSIDTAPTVVYNGVTYKELVADSGAKIYYAPAITVTKIDPTLQMSAFSVSYDDGAYLVGSGIDQYVGWKVANAGDINKDGLDDIIVNKVDGAYLVFGNDSMSGQIDLANLSGRGIEITGNGVTAAGLIDTGYQSSNWNLYNYGVTAIGDVNGDGYDDLATTRGDVNATNTNTITVIYGKNEPVNVALGSFVSGAANGFNITVAGFPNSRYTSIANVGDVNGDGYQDLVIGNSFANSGLGEAYLVFGGSYADINTTTAQTSRWIKLSSDSSNKTNIGVDISGLGDVNSDGFADFAIGGPGYVNAVQTGSTTQTDYSGSGYVIFGKAEGWANTTVVQKDFVKPLMASLTPADNATGISVTSDLSLTFNENVQFGSSGYITLLRASNDSIVERFDVATGLGNLGGKLWQANSTTFGINPVNALAGNTDFYLKVDAGAIRDYSGNNFDGVSTTTGWNFSTAAASTDTTAPNP